MKLVMNLCLAAQLTIPCAVVAQDNHLEHVTNIEHEQVAGFNLDYPPTKPKVAFAVFRNTACRKVISDADATAAVLTIAQDAWLGPLGYMISYGTDRDQYSSVLGRFDLYCVGGEESGKAEQIVAIFANAILPGSGYGSQSLDAYGLHRNGPTWEIRFPVDVSHLALPGTDHYQFLGLLQSSEKPWAFAVFFGEPAHSNTAVFDLGGREVYVGTRSSPMLVRENRDAVLYVLATERVPSPDTGSPELWADLKRMRQMEPMSRTHRADVLRRVSESGAKVIESVVYRFPSPDDDLPEDAVKFQKDVEERFKVFRERGVTIEVPQ